MVWKRITVETSSLVKHLEDLRPQLSEAAQKVYDSWDPSGEDGDPEVGFGGICDEIRKELSDVISNHDDICIHKGESDGDDHAWLIVHRGKEVMGVNIPAYHYESGGGYNWFKKPGVQFGPEHIEIWPMGRTPKDMQDWFDAIKDDEGCFDNPNG